MPSTSDYQTVADVTGTLIATSSGSVEILPENAHRVKVVLSNDSANEAWFIKLGPTAALTDFTYRLPASGNLVLEVPMYTGSISGIQGADDGPILVTEFTKPEFGY